MGAIQKRNYQSSIPGYTKKVYLKLARRVHSHLKKKGMNPTWNESQRFTSRYLYPQYKYQLLSKIDLKDVDGITDWELSQTTLKEKTRKIIPEIIENCGSVFAVPDGDLTLIEWYDIGNAVRIMPNDIKLRVNGGPYGLTTIELNSNIDYHQSGIADIVARIRADVNNDSGAEYYWEGLRKLVPGRADNGENCNYFIDFVLEINGVLVSTPEIEVSSKERIVEPSDEDKESRIERKKSAESEKKIRRAKAKSEKEEIRLKKQKLQAAKTRTRAKEAPKEEIAQDYAKMLELLQKDYQLEVFTVGEYKKERAKIIALQQKNK